MKQNVPSLSVSDSKVDLQEKYPDDFVLVNAILGGNKSAMADFLAKNCYPIFRKILIERLNRLDLKEDDLINDFYIYLSDNNWKKLRDFRFESKLQTWINIVASRYLYSKYRKELQENAKENPPIDDKTLLSLSSSEKKMTTCELNDAIEKLTNERDRQLLELTLEGLKTEEIAELLDISCGNVYVVRNRAINNLKRLLNNEG